MNNNNNKFLLPGIIVLVILVISLIFYFSKTSNTNTDNNTKPKEDISVVKNSMYSLGFIKKAAVGMPAKVDQKYDYILGNSNADSFVLEYSDLECPYCKLYHSDTVENFADKYIKTGKIAFVFRHFPIAKPFATRNLHPSSTQEAIAAECVGAVAGDKKFYAFISTIFNSTKSDGKFDTTLLPKIVQKMGVDMQKWQACYKDSRTLEKIKKSFEEGVNAGVDGTPKVFIIGKDGLSNRIPSKSLKKEVIEDILDTFLKESSKNK